MPKAIGFTRKCVEIAMKARTLRADVEAAHLRSPGAEPRPLEGAEPAFAGETGRPEGRQ